MSLCKNCGCMNPDESLFCWKCGSRLEPCDIPTEPPTIEEPQPDATSCMFDAHEEPEQICVHETPAQVQSVSFDDTAPKAETGRNVIDLGPQRSIDFGPSERSENVREEKRSRSRKERPVRERLEHRTTAPADPFNAKIAVMITGVMSILIACYCLFGYKPTYILKTDGHSMEQLAMPFQTMSSAGIGGIMPSDIMAVCVALTIVVAVISAIRAVPMITGLAGLITTALYYNVATVMGIDYSATMSATSMMTLVVLWIVVIVLSVFQFAFLKKFSASCEDEPYPLIKIWFGKL